MLFAGRSAGAEVPYLTNLGDINDALDAFGYPESYRLGIAIGGGGTASPGSGGC